MVGGSPAYYGWYSPNSVQTLTLRLLPVEGSGGLVIGLGFKV